MCSGKKDKLVLATQAALLLLYFQPTSAIQILDLFSPTAQGDDNNRISNTSISITVPIVQFSLPQRSPSATSSAFLAALTPAYQIFYGIASLGVIAVVTAAVRIYGNHKEQTMRAAAADDSFVYNSGDRLGGLFGEGQDCLYKTICKAHQRPLDYGIMAWPFLWFFPPAPKESSLDSPYMLAATRGRASQLNCESHYNCLLDFFDIAHYIAFIMKRIGYQ